MESIQQHEKYLSWVFFPHRGISIKAAVITPLKYNSDTYHFTICFAQNGKSVLNPEHLVLFSSILVGMLTKYNSLPFSSKEPQVEPHLLILQGRITVLWELWERNPSNFSSEGRGGGHTHPNHFPFACVLRSMALSCAWFLGNEAVIQVLIPKLKLVCNVLDDASLEQPVPIDHSFPTVRGKADLQQPVHQVTAKEDASGGLCTTPVCQRNDSPICSVNLVSPLHDGERQGKTAGNKERHHDS